MPAAIIAAIQALLPYVVDLVREHHAETGELPTNEQVIERFHKRMAGYIAEGRASQEADRLATGGGSTP